VIKTLEDYERFADGMLDKADMDIVRELVARCRTAEAELEQAKRERDRLREALTPSETTKAAYIGGFTYTDGEGGIYTVPWTAVKNIMAAILKQAALAPHADHVPDAGQMVHTFGVMGEWHQSEPDVKPTPFVPHEFVRVGTTESPIPQPDPLAEARRLLEDAEPRLGHSINCSRIKDWEAPCNCGLETARASIIAYLAAHPEPGK